MKKRVILFTYALTFTLSYASERNYSIGIYSDANNKSQEDTAIAVQKNGGTFLGLFDGHAGYETAFILERDLQKFFFESIEIKLLSNEKQKIKKALFESLEKIENHVLDACTDGSTAIVSYINPKRNRLHVFNVGDSGLILESNGTVGFVTQPHDLADENGAEFKRILDANGQIFRFITIKARTRELIKSYTWRINGLEMTRSIGDRDSKGKGAKSLIEKKRIYNGGIQAIFEVYNPNMTHEKKEKLLLTPQVGQVIATPDYKKIVLTEQNRWLIQFSDGFSDFVTPAQAIDFVVQYSQEGKTPQDIAQHLVNKAIELGSKDNVTVIVHDLHAQEK